MSRQILGPAWDFAARPNINGAPVALLSEAGGGSTDYAQGSFTVATGNYKLMVKRLELTGTQRATLEGTSRLSIVT